MGLIYEVEVRYKMTGGALSGLKSLERGARSASSAFNGLRTAMVILGAAGVFGKLKKAFYDFNSEVAGMKVGLATAFSANLKIPFVEAQKEADKLFKKFQAFAKDAPGTSKDYLEVASWIGRSMAMAGGNMNQLEKITEATTLASEIYPTLKGKGGMQVAARDIDQFLRGMITVRDPLSNQILTELKLDKKDVNKASMSERIDMLMKWAETAQKPGGALYEGKNALRQTPAGAWSAIEERLQILMGQAGERVTKAIAKTLLEVSDWIDKNQSKIDSWVNATSSFLLGAFRAAMSAAEAIKGIMSWMADNSTTLISLAQVFLAFKGVNIVANVASGLGALAGAMNPAILAVGAFTVAFVAVTGFLMDREDEMRRRNQAAEQTTAELQMYRNSKIQTARVMRENAKWGNANDMALGASTIEEQRRAARRVLLIAKDAGALTPIMGGAPGEADHVLGAQLDKQKLINYLAAANGDKDLAMAQANEIERAFKDALTDQAKLLSAFFGVDPAQKSGLWSYLKGSAGGGAEGAFVPAKTNVNVTINKIEVASDDPDRFVMNAVKAFEDMERNPTQATAALRGGLG